jgi:hypothetical protein
MLSTTSATVGAVPPTEIAVLANVGVARDQRDLRGRH